MLSQTKLIYLDRSVNPVTLKKTRKQFYLVIPSSDCSKNHRSIIRKLFPLKAGHFQDDNP